MVSSRNEGREPAGPGRRRVLAAGLGGAVVAGMAGSGLTAGTAAAASPTAVTGTGRGVPREAGAWHRYVEGPSARTVRPIGTFGTTAGVSRPDALLKPGGRTTVLTRTAPTPPPRRPDGTTAEASARTRVPSRGPPANCPHPKDRCASSGSVGTACSR